MAHGFAHPTSGLIAGWRSQPDARIRFTIDFARAYVDALTVVVEGTAADLVSLERRASWVRSEFPDVKVVEHRDSVAPFTDAASALRFDFLFSADSADRELAARYGARFIPCFPVAALRYAPEAHDERAFAAQPARPVLRVCLFGPESTGKTTLASQLAQHYGTAHAADYVRAYLDVTGSLGTISDVPWIARGQLATEAAAAAQARRLLICDTTLASVALWSDVLYSATPAWIDEQARRQYYDLWLLTDIDVPFEPDPLRCFPEPAKRAWFMAKCRRTLAELGVVPVLVRGPGHERLALACDAIDRMLS